MSFIHCTIVGHFDPTTIPLQLVRPLDIAAAEALLAEFPPEVTNLVEFRDGYAKCWWAGVGGYSLHAPTHEYASRLAEALGCIAAEGPVNYIVYPESAKRLQAEAWDRWRKENPAPPDPPRPPATFDPPLPPIPCPYCGKLLRTAIARQCRHCKMDWHDSDNVFRRGMISGSVSPAAHE